MAGMISMRQFVDMCHTQDIFDVLQIREVAKRTNIIENLNPNISRESTLSKDLFGGRLSAEELNHGVEDNLMQLPAEFSDAVLYKVVQTIDQ